MHTTQSLPPGQVPTEKFPRFGLPQYANRFPRELDHINISIGGDVGEFEISAALSTLPRVEQVSDFHCVTTWSKLELNWGGYRFADFYSSLILPKVRDAIKYVVLKGQDGYKTSLPLSDLLHPSVLLCDKLDQKPLTIEHGAPIRLVAPAHYGYKNIKHLNRIEFYTEKKSIKHGLSAFMDHPRARVAHEERAAFGPGIFFRYLYRVGIQNTIRTFEKATREYRLQQDQTTK